MLKLIVLLTLILNITISTELFSFSTDSLIATNSEYYLDFTDCSDPQLKLADIENSGGIANIISLPNGSFFNSVYFIFDEDGTRLVQNGFTPLWGFRDFTNHILQIPNPLDPESYYLLTTIGTSDHPLNAYLINTTDNSLNLLTINDPNVKDVSNENIAAHKIDDSGIYILTILNTGTEPSIDFFELDISSGNLDLTYLDISYNFPENFKNFSNLRSGLQFDPTGNHLIFNSHIDSTLFYFKLDYQNKSIQDVKLDKSNLFGTIETQAELSSDGDFLFVVKNIDLETRKPISLDNSNVVSVIKTEDLLSGSTDFSKIFIQNENTDTLKNILFYDIGLLPDASLGFLSMTWGQDSIPFFTFYKSNCINSLTFDSQGSMNTLEVKEIPYETEIPAENFRYFSTPAFENTIRSDYRKFLNVNLKENYAYCPESNEEINIFSDRCTEVFFVNPSGTDTIYTNSLKISDIDQSDFGEWTLYYNQCEEPEITTFTISDEFTLEPELTVICDEDEGIELNATSGYQYYTWFKDGNIVAEGAELNTFIAFSPGIYRVTATIDGCERTIEKEIELFEEDTNQPNFYVDIDCSTGEYIAYVENSFDTPIILIYNGQEIYMESGDIQELPFDLIFVDGNKFLTTSVSWEYGYKCLGSGEIEFDNVSGVESARITLPDKTVFIGDIDIMQLEGKFFCATNEQPVENMVFSYDSKIIHLNRVPDGNIINVSTDLDGIATASVLLDPDNPRLEFIALLAEGNYTDINVLSIGNSYLDISTDSSIVDLKNGSYTVEEECPGDRARRLITLEEEVEIKSLTINNEYIELNLSGSNLNTAKLELINTNGQVIISKDHLEHDNFIDISNISNGNYLVIVKSINNVSSKYIQILKR